MFDCLAVIYLSVRGNLYSGAIPEIRQKTLREKQVVILGNKCDNGL